MAALAVDPAPPPVVVVLDDDEEVPWKYVYHEENPMALAFEVFGASASGKPIVTTAMNLYVLGAPLNMIEHLWSAAKQHPAFFDNASNFNFGKLRGTASDLVAECSSKCNSLNGDHYYLRSTLARSRALEGLSFLNRSEQGKEELGRDQMSLNLLLRIFPIRVQNVTKSRRTSGVRDPEGLANILIFATMLLDVFDDARVAANLARDVLTDVGATNSRAIEDRINAGEVAMFPDFHTIGACTAKKYLALVIQHGSEVLLDKTARLLRRCYAKTISTEATQLGAGWARKRAEVSARGVEIIHDPASAPVGHPLGSFASKIATLRTRDELDSNTQRAKIHLVWGHIISLLTLKVRDRRLVEQLKKKPTGLKGDGVTIKGRKYECCRVRGDFYHEGIYQTLTLPPFLVPQFSDKDMDEVLQSEVRLRRDKKSKDDFVLNCEQAAVCERVSALISPVPLIFQRPAHITGDRGSTQRGFYQWATLEACLPVFYNLDVHHISSNDIKHLAQLILPRDFHRFPKIRSTAGGSQSVKLADYLNRFHQLPDSDVMDLTAEVQADLLHVLGYTPDQTEYAARAKDHAYTLVPKISTMCQQKRFAKDAFCADFVGEYWELLLVAVVACLRKRNSRLFNVPLKEVLTRPNGGDHVTASFPVSQMNLMYMRLDEEDAADAQEEMDMYVQDADRSDELAQEKEDDAERNAATRARIGLKQNKSLENVAKDGSFLAGSKHRVRAAQRATTATHRGASDDRESVRAVARPSEMVIDQALLCVMCRLLSEPFSKLSVLVFRHCIRPNVWLHTLGITMCWRNFCARKGFFAEHYCCLCEQGHLLHDKVPRRILQVECDYFPGTEVVAELMGTFVEEQLATSLRTGRVAMSLWYRPLMYAEDGVWNCTLSELREQAKLKNLGPSVDWILSEPLHFVSSEEHNLVLYGKQRFRYAHNILPQTSLHLAGPHPAELPRPDVAEMPSGMFTSMNTQPVVSIVEFEDTLAQRIKEARLQISQQARDVVFYLMKIYNSHIVREMREKLDAGKSKEFVETMTAWQAVNPLGDRDTEAKFADLSRAAKNANNSGYLKGQHFPWHVAESLAPTWLPFLSPEMSAKKPRNVGTSQSFSVLDGREPAARYGCANYEELKQKIWPEGLDFEINTIGLHAMSSVFCWWELYGIKDIPAEENPVEHLKNWLKKHPKPKLEEVREEIQRTCAVQGTDHTLTLEQKKSLASFVCNIQNVPSILVAEFIIYEQIEFLKQDTVDAQLLWQGGELVCIWLLGIHQQFRKMKRPLIVRTCGHGKLSAFLVVEVLVKLRVLVCIELDFIEFVVERIKSVKETSIDVDEDEGEIDEDAMDICEDGPKDKPAEAKERSRALSARPLGKGIDAPVPGIDVPMEEARFFTVPSGRDCYRFPFPIKSGRAQESKLKGLLVLSDKIIHPSGPNFGSLEIVYDARWVTGPADCVCVDQRDAHNCQPVALAERFGFFDEQNKFADGHRSNRKKQYIDCCYLVAREFPVLVNLLRGRSWKVTRDHLIHEPIVVDEDAPAEVRNEAQNGDQASANNLHPAAGLLGGATSSSSNQHPDLFEERLLPREGEAVQMSKTSREQAEAVPAQTSSSSTGKGIPVQEPPLILSEDLDDVFEDEMEADLFGFVTENTPAHDAAVDAAADPLQPGLEDEPMPQAAEPALVPELSSAETEVKLFESYAELFPKLQLTLRQWVEVWFIMRRGIAEAEGYLLKKDFFEKKQVKVGDEVQEMPVSTLETTAARAVLLLKEADATRRRAAAVVRNLQEGNLTQTRGAAQMQPQPKANRFGKLVDKVADGGASALATSVGAVREIGGRRQQRQQGLASIFFSLCCSSVCGSHRCESKRVCCAIL
ncbi:unnamed protein product [Amoebophrya sp. A25]|nr:unnamed protein product [Amoebophrya sp. A25]|eukprot:GSA25T00018075001.1